MKQLVIAVLFCTVTSISFAQVANLHYRVVPEDQMEEFEKRETQYWSKVAKAAIDKGQMEMWSLWKKVGMTEPDAPNYVFVNSFKDYDAMDPATVWGEENLKALGAEVKDVETWSMSKVALDYVAQLEAVIPANYKYAVVNYAKPESLGGFIEENKMLWKPMHEKTIKEGDIGMKSWGLMSVTYPQGQFAYFSCLTWDGFDKLGDAMKYISYQKWDEENLTDDWKELMSKSKMDEIMPKGFEARVIYELVMQVSADN